ncbi:undecaprenyl-diphosphatase UppP [Caldalkalibacillus salinus]|uniref:undecaprenyl-diphosphatase UppP n=1 Tax=Caldalkalibacillus salinus TaxID=2803787 RepID=UPI0019229678|nr:undecaprenyl-diphosphatase UppP [Caldalkalibacillus salinus]
MSLIEALILGIVQGITEFLPISSTAHIVITSIVLDLEFEGLAFEIFLHLASVLAVIMYFRKDLMTVIKGFFGYFKDKSTENTIQFRFAIYLIVATIITGVLGIVLKDVIDESMKTPPFIAGSLTITGLFLIFIERFHQIGNKDEESMTWLDTIIVAIGQTLAVLPGISRSGATLVAALWTGLTRETAVRFSFLLSIPVILGSTVLMFKDLSMDMVHSVGVTPLVISFIASFLFSIIGIMWLIDFLQKSKLVYFAVYCFALAFIVFFFLDPGLTMDME